MTPPRCTHPPKGPAAQAARNYRAILPRLETARLHLRAPQIEDLPAWTALFTGPDAHLLGGPHTDEEAWEAFCVYTAGWLLHGHGAFAVVRKSDETTLGFVLIGLEWGDEEPELGWFFLPEHRGHGYATEAAAAARSLGLSLYGPGGLVSYIDPDNAASNALAARLGAIRDGSLHGSNRWRHS